MHYNVFTVVLYIYIYIVRHNIDIQLILYTVMYVCVYIYIFEIVFLAKLFWVDMILIMILHSHPSCVYSVEF